MRRRRPERREVPPDPVYGDEMVQKFINNAMRKGKKGIAEKNFYQAMDLVSSRTKGDPLEMFHKAMNNVKPLLEVKSRRIGGATYQIPMEVQKRRGYALATRWILASVGNRKGHSMAENLAAEFIDAANGEGGAIKKKDDTHRMAEANKAFAHYR
ncbi:MAG: 30S ribosomal protein S7 [Candidatus Neomarinimicrobiota bacterium]